MDELRLLINDLNTTKVNMQHELQQHVNVLRQHDDKTMMELRLVKEDFNTTKFENELQSELDRKSADRMMNELMLVRRDLKSTTLEIKKICNNIGMIHAYCYNTVANFVDSLAYRRRLHQVCVSKFMSDSLKCTAKNIILPFSKNIRLKNI